MQTIKQTNRSTFVTEPLMLAEGMFTTPQGGLVQTIYVDLAGWQQPEALSLAKISEPQFGLGTAHSASLSTRWVWSSKICPCPAGLVLLKGRRRLTTRAAAATVACMELTTSRGHAIWTVVFSANLTMDQHREIAALAETSRVTELKISSRASTAVRKLRRLTRAYSSVTTKLSHSASSYVSPTEPIDCTMPASQHRFPEASDVYCEP